MQRLIHISKRGSTVVLSYCTAATPIGKIFVVASTKGLRALRLLVETNAASLLDNVRAADPGAEFAEDPKRLKPIVKQIVEVIEGTRAVADIALDPVGTPFEMRVWRELTLIPWGQTASYGDIAQRIGKPLAVRAVGTACGKNRIGFVIPCHRILRKGGGLGGYYWGLDVKQRLLERER